LLRKLQKNAMGLLYFATPSTGKHVNNQVLHAFAKSA